MKKIILTLVVSIGLCSFLVANNTPEKTQVKMGELINNIPVLTYDLESIKSAFFGMVENYNQTITNADLFVEDGNYYLWCETTTNGFSESKGKLVFSLELDAENNLLLSAKPIYKLQCVPQNQCSACGVSGTQCACTAWSGSGGSCVWERVIISQYTISFEKLLTK